jgi:predicted dehydrogenase
MTPLRTVIIGFGRVAAGDAREEQTARYYAYPTHARVLADHLDFRWEAVVDPSEERLALARTRWGIAHTARTVGELVRQYVPEVAVIATPPEARLSILRELPPLRAVLVEKPLGLTAADARAFADECSRRGVLAQVNLWRRADEAFRGLAAGGLKDCIGPPQAVFGVYGNGLLNNGTHLIDFVRMLFGEVDAVQAVDPARAYPAGPIPGDVDVAFTLRLCSGLPVATQALRFEHYREVGLDIWGQNGRLSILQEGLDVTLYPRRPNRALPGDHEIAVDEPQPMKTTVGHALYQMYGNLAAAVRDGEVLFGAAHCAVRTASVVEAILQSVRTGGAWVPVAERAVS